jgi:hypothetical protein
MFKRIVLVIGSYFILSVLSINATEAGFADFLKNIQKALQGEQALTQEDIIDGLKEALEMGATNAVKKVSVVNGYYKNPKIKIPLPENIQKVKKLLTKTGLGSQVKSFELSMNRAAERAAPGAKRIFWNAIKQMRFSDARRILNGADNEATLYFKDKTFDRLEKTFRPVTRKAMTEVGVTRHYRELNDRMADIPFLDHLSFDLDQYVTARALDGLFLILAEEEKKIRQDPAARVTDILKKVFGKK